LLPDFREGYEIYSPSVNMQESISGSPYIQNPVFYSLRRLQPRFSTGLGGNCRAPHSLSVNPGHFERLAKNRFQEAAVHLMSDSFCGLHFEENQSPACKQHVIRLRSRKL